MLRLLLVDPNNLFRLGLAALLDNCSTVRIVAQARDGLEAIEQARRHRPDVVLTEIDLPRGNGLVVAKLLAAELPQIKVVILTGLNESEIMLEALRCGVAGYLLKDLEPTRLFQMLDKARQGETPLSGVVATQVLNIFRQHGPDGQGSICQSEALTPREVEVLAEVVKGATNKEIARTLCITENTVKSLVCNILAKLQVNNRIQAAVLAVRHGLLNDKNQNQAFRSEADSIEFNLALEV